MTPFAWFAITALIIVPPLLVGWSIYRTSRRRNVRFIERLNDTEGDG